MQRGYAQTIRSPALVCALMVRREQVEDVVAGYSGERAVERHKAPAVPTRQAEEIAIRDLLAGMCAPHLGHGGRRESIRPEFVGPAGGGEQEQPVRSRLRNPKALPAIGHTHVSRRV